MGNNISGLAARPAGALDTYVIELSKEIVYESSLGSSRFLKTVKARHKNGPIVIKIFIKHDPALTLRTYQRRLKMERESLHGIPNVYTYQSFLETDSEKTNPAGYIIRQWLGSNLYDRISTRPFLSAIERKWIAFQLLSGMRDARQRKISHGDIKSENVLITSWNWVYITDFASFKPVYLPEDDPTDFSFYFDTSGRRTCYIAPERFYTAGSEISKKKAELDFDKRDGKVTEAMDVFSLGCVIAELFLEGKDTFTLSQLFKYRAGELSMDSHLAMIEDEGIRSLVMRMIALDPTARGSFEELLTSSRDTTFPECFYSFLHNYVISVNEVSSPSPFTKTTPAGHAATLEKAIGPGAELTLPSDSDHRLDRIWADFDMVEPYLAPEMDATVMDLKDELGGAGSSKALQDVLPVELHIPNRSHKLRGGLMSGQRAASEDGPALIIVALVCANIRNCVLPSSKVHALDILLALASHLTDEAKLDRVVPYVVDLLHDDAAVVRASALRTLMQALMLVSAITPANAAIFPEYIFPNIRHIARDPEVSVRCMYAQCIVTLADTSVRYLEMGQALKAHGTFKLAEADMRHEISYDRSLQDLQSVIQEDLVLLLVDQSSVVKRAVLYNIASLCVFFGKQKTNDVLLSHMITYLNHRDWLLRYAFFDSIVGVAACVGSRSLEEYILPLMIQALSDVEETVVAKVLSSLTSLSELGLFQKMRIWELMSATIGFLYHPNIWIRQGAAAFISSAARQLPSTDVWCILYPSLRPLLRADIRAITEQSLLSTIKPMIPRQIFDTAVAWARREDKSLFWRAQLPRGKPSRDTSKETLSSLKSSSALSRTNFPKSEEDEAQIVKLQQLGMTPADEEKLLSLRDYISKLADAINSFSSRIKMEGEVPSLTNNIDVELQKLDVVPQTVFLALREGTARSTPRHEVSARRTLGERRTSMMQSPSISRTSRRDSVDLHSRDGTNFDDLRRRLSQIDGSSSSVSAAPGVHTMRPTKRRDSLSSAHSYNPSHTGADLTPHQHVLEPPTSPSESAMSTAITPSSLQNKHRIHIGSADGSKAPPAIGSIRTNATGLLEITTKLRTGDDEHSPSGRSSPTSATGTIRGDGRTRPMSSNQFSTTYEGQEPAIRNLLEHVYQDSFRQPPADFGPRVHQGPVRRRSSARSNFPARDPNARPSEATLIAHLTSHTGPINGIAVSPDHVFFVSCSDDKTVKVWDTARLERNVTSKPRHTYNHHNAKVTCVCTVEASHCFASAAEDGSLHVVRVHVVQGGTLPKYGSKLQLVREHRTDHPGEYATCLEHYNTDTTSTLIYTTNLSSIVMLDLRMMRTLQTMENPRHYGSITCICVDRRRMWLIVGTSTGTLTLWDLRFGLHLKSWKVGVSGPEGLLSTRAQFARVHKCVVHPTKGKNRWVMVAVETRTSPTEPRSGSTLIEVWDIEKTVLMETFVTQETTMPLESDSITTLDSEQEIQEVVGEEAERSPAAAIAALVRARMAGQSSRFSSGHGSNAGSGDEDDLWTRSDVRTILAGTDFGGVGGFALSRGGGRGPRSPDASVYPGMRIDSSTRDKTSGKGYLITGSEDRKIRFWDLGKPEHSAVVSGLGLDSQEPIFRTIRSLADSSSAIVEVNANEAAQSTTSRPQGRTSLISNNQQQLLKAHQDAITALASIDSPFKCGIVSGDRAGVIKVFRIESD